MKLRIRNGRANLRRVTPRADGPGGKIRVKNKETGKTTFVSQKTLEDHPDRYEAPKQKARDKTLEKQKRRQMSQKEVKRRQDEEKTKQEQQQQEEEKRLEEMTPQQRREVEKKKRQEEEQKAKEEEQKQEKEKAKETAVQRRKERQTKEEEGREKSRVQKERRDTWKQIANDHPELNEKQQQERQELFMETGIDSGGQRQKAIRWWLRHHGQETDQGVNLDKPKEQRKLDKKSIQEHWKYGPKPTKKGKCSGQLKAVKVGTITICVDPNVYDVEGK